MFCSISGEPTKDPVLSSRSNRIFERRLIETYISENGTDPITNDEMDISDLIPIHLDAVNEIGVSALTSSQTTGHTSIPSLLSSFQNEWDSLALEVFQLRKQLLESKQELSLALYRHDAAVRVAARAVEERDAAREALQQLAINIGTGNPVAENGFEPINGSKNVQEYHSSMFDELSERINEAQQSLFQLHKSTKYPAVFQPQDEILIHDEINASIQDGDTALDAHFYQDQDQNILLLNAPRTVAVAYSKEKNGSIEKTEEYSYEGIKISASAWLHTENTPLIALENGLIYHGTEQIVETVYKDDSIVSLLMHPDTKLQLLIIVSRTGSYTLFDLDRREIAFTSKVPNAEVTITQACIHPDGKLLALSNKKEGSIELHDISRGTFELKLPFPEDIMDKLECKGYKDIISLMIAKNGYSLFALYSTETDNFVCVHDLRKNIISSFWSVPSGTDQYLSVDDSTTLCFTGSQLHRYLKKGKLWEGCVSQLQQNKEESPLVKSIFLPGSKSIFGISSAKTVHVITLSNSE